MSWADRVETLLYDGEACERRFDLESASASLVVTSHRVLAFTPDDDGADFRQVDRPNVDGVTIATAGRFGYCRRAITFGFVGIGLLSLSAAVSFDSLVPSLESAGVDSSTPGVEGIAAAVTQVERVLSVIDALVLVGGLSITAAALAFVGLYLRSRSRTLVLEVAGDDDIEVPVDAGDDLAIADLERAIRPGSTVADRTVPAVDVEP